MSNEVVLLSHPTNFAVVQLPERNYPGVVVQGDTLKSLVSDLNEMAHLLKIGDTDELAAAIENTKTQLTDALVYFEGVCREKKINVPYLS